MKKLLMSLAIASTALTAAAPAAAQYRDRGYDVRSERGYDDRDYRRGRDVEPQLHRLNQQISRAVQRGTISNGEARGLRAEVQNLWQVAARFHRTGGYDGREYAQLQRRIDRVEDRLRYERRDDNRRWR